MQRRKKGKKVIQKKESIGTEDPQYCREEK
jgi:hypothetical protein